ncbi:DNA-directed RNA polymerase subunit beta' [Candidatus Vidania fulgoroideorum]
MPKCKIKNLKYLKISLASAVEILSWSSGEIKNSETINYRTLKPEVAGLFCQRIFGPIKDFYCNCNNYKNSNVKNGVCKICNVIINKKELRRKNMGHITLEAPVFHIWFLKVMPSRLSLILNFKLSELEKIIYYEKYIIISSKIKNIPEGKLITEKEYYNYIVEYGNSLVMKTGAEAIELIIEKIDLIIERSKAKSILKKNKFKKIYQKNLERYNFINDLIKNNFNIKSFIIKILPVLPPDLRPIVKIKNDKFASSDLNELYRRVINRNNRLKKLNNIGAPEFVVKNEKKMLQESVDCLFDNGRKGKFFKNNTKKLFKSLSENIRGKKGRFRQNLLGKRVDYSGRSVIVVEPNINIDQCGLPLNIALELFRPFIYNYLVKNGFSLSINLAKEEVDNKTKIATYAVKKIIKKRPIILNRAPTLHRLGIQSFNAYIVKDFAIHIHPLVCVPFNADFDGDQMAVHIPLSKESVLESKKILLSSLNVFYPSNGNVSINPTQDIILGLYFLSNNCPSGNRPLLFSNESEILKYYFISNEKNREIIFKISQGKFIKTTIRRMFLYIIMPIKRIFIKFNKVLNKKDIYDMVDDVYNLTNKKILIKFITDLTKLGFDFATKSGISLSLSDFNININKKKKTNKIFKIFNYYNSKKNVISDLKIYKKKLALWNYFIYITNFKSMDKLKNLSKNTLNFIFSSGSKCSEQQINQLIGTKGLTLKHDGKIINMPIISNYYAGLNFMQYFVSTYGARKGLVDTSLKTANSGYLTRRLVDVTQDLVINLKDCYTKKYYRLILDRENINDYYGYCIFDNIYYKKNIILKKNSVLNKSNLNIILNYNINYINIRSPIFCSLNRGICSYCYGYDFSKKRIVDIGEAIGIIAAQSIGEPGTQLTMRTFHTGGVLYNTKKIFSSFVNCFGFVLFSHNSLINYVKNIIYFLNNSDIIILNLNGEIVLKNNFEAGIFFRIKKKFFPFYINKKIEVNLKRRVFYCESKNFDFKNIIFKNNFIYIKKKKMLSSIVFYKKLSVPFIKINIKKIIYFICIRNLSLINIKKKNNKKTISFFITDNKKNSSDITDSLKKISNLFENRHKSYGKTCCITGIKKIYKKRIMIYNCHNYIKNYIKVTNNFKSNCYLDNVILKGSKLNLKSCNFNEIINVVGLERFCFYFKKKIYSIYRQYGIEINKKHIEIILLKMIKNKIIKSFSNKNFKKKYYYKKFLMGITKSSLLSDSFISSASFQETIKILVQSSIVLKKDYLLGIKENVIIGRLIPAGTGFFSYDYNKSINKKKQKKKK